MATKKQRREAAQAKRAAYEAQLREQGLAAQKRAREQEKRELQESRDEARRKREAKRMDEERKADPEYQRKLAEAKARRKRQRDAERTLRAAGANAKTIAAALHAGADMDVERTGTQVHRR